MPSKYSHAIRLPWFPSEKRWCLWFALKRNRSFPLSTPPCKPYPNNWSKNTQRTLTVRRRGTSQHCQSGEPQVPAAGGTALQRYKSSTRSTLPGGAALQLCQWRRSPHVCQSEPFAHPPPSPAHSIRGGTERGYNRRSRSRVWGLCYTDLSIMILGSPIQGIRCRPCSWYWAFSSSRNSLQA